MIPISIPLKARHVISTSEEFINSLYTLTDLQKKVNYDYEILQNLSQDFKESRVFFIGNPFIRLQTDFVEITYLLKLHVLNCNVYNDLLFDDIDIDDNLNLQLKSLLATTQDLCERYVMLNQKLSATPLPRRSKGY